MRYTVITFAAAAFITVAACSPNVESRGYMQEPDWQKQVTIGQTTREDMLSLLGSPSSRSSFGPEEWYYIALKRESYGFLKPEIAEQDVTRISFNDDGTVKAIDRFDKSSAQDVAIASRTTRTEGHQLTFTEQLLGNLGRFNSPGSAPGGKGPTGAGIPGGR